MKKKIYYISESELNTIYQHSYNLYSAVEEMYEDFRILYKTLEKIRANPNNENPKITHIYKNKFEDDNIF